MKKLFAFLGKLILGCVLFLCVCVMVGVAFCRGYFYYGRRHGDVVVKSYAFEESSKEVVNPYRGFHRMYGIILKDEEEQ